ncbi:MAG: hypothetical protein M1817_000263 [Caeruleum heppii]|nr:MAG: hypothetical protein M1817_000263 [Caeruleum heppii]
MSSSTSCQDKGRAFLKARNLDGSQSLNRAQVLRQAPYAFASPSASALSASSNLGPSGDLDQHPSRKTAAKAARKASAINSTIALIPHPLFADKTAKDECSWTDEYETKKALDECRPDALSPKLNGSRRRSSPMNAIDRLLDELQALPAIDEEDSVKSRRQKEV